MAWRNGPDTYGLVSRVLHWGMAILIVIMLALGLRISNMQPGLSNLWLYGLHKSLGITLLSLVVLRLVWHIASPPPPPIGPPGAMRMLVRVWHWMLYALMIAIPLSGWAGSSASGIDTVIFNRFTIPPLIAPSARSEFIWFILHEIFAKTLLGMVIIHMLGALRREMAGDGTLTRMLRGRR